MRISDWSSDVCSSDLGVPGLLPGCRSRGWPCRPDRCDSDAAFERIRLGRSILAPRSLPPQARQPDLRHVRESISTGGVPPVADVTRLLRALRLRDDCPFGPRRWLRSEETTYERQSLM